MSEETETSSSPEQETSSEEQKTESLLEQPPESEAPEEDTPAAEEEPAPEPLTAESITFPEDLQVSDELRDEFLSVMNNDELSAQERAQALVDLQVKAATATAEASSQQFEEQQKAWQDEVKSDDKLGKGNFQKTLSNVQSLVEQYGSDELVEVMALTGAGNNIHVIRFLNSMAADLLEGKPATGGPTNVESDRASRMFPSMKG